MSLKSICNEVLAQSGFPSLNTVSPSNDPQAQQMFALANAELVFLSEQHKWPHLEIEYTFPTVPGQRVYALPANFRTLVSDTLFDSDQYYRIKGSLPDSEFMAMRFGNFGDLARTRFKLQYGLDGTAAVVLMGQPTGVRQLVCLYNRKEYARNAAGQAMSTYMADADMSAIPEQLIKLGLAYRFRRAKGLDYSAELVEYNTSVKTALAQFSGAGSVRVGYYFDDEYLPCGTVPESGFGV